MAVAVVVAVEEDVAVVKCEEVVVDGVNVLLLLSLLLGLVLLLLIFILALGRSRLETDPRRSDPIACVKLRPDSGVVALGCMLLVSRTAVSSLRWSNGSVFSCIDSES